MSEERKQDQRVWDPTQRPPAAVCPKSFCFNWVPAGGVADMTGKTYSTFTEAVSPKAYWTSFPSGGCGSIFGRCTRKDPENGDRDCYEPCEPNLRAAGLPWFYFSTTDNLHSDFHERFLRESEAYWGCEADRESESVRARPGPYPGVVDVEAAGNRLHEALKERDPEAVRTVLSETPSAANWPNAEGRTALFLTRNRALVELLLEAGADVHHTDSHGFTPLHRVQISGSPEVTQLLLDRGARVDTVDCDGWTPLHAAATFLSPGSVQLLLVHGADPKARNKRGYTPLHEALDDGNVRTVRYLWAEPSNRDVFLAAGLGETAVLGEALAAHPELARAVDGRVRTPLHWAARCGQPECARLLLEAGADPNATDEGNWTPMHWAAYGYPINERSSRGPASFEVAVVLDQHGGNRSPISRAGKTPLDLLDHRLWDKPALAQFLRASDA